MGGGSADAHAAGPHAADTVRPRSPLLLPVLLAAQAMAAMDTSIVNVAAPVIHRTLALSGATLQMVIAGYVFTYAVLLITGARLGDDHGYRHVFVVGLTIFTVASVACGLAADAVLLIAARVIQGVGAALFVPQVLSLIQTNYEGAERARVVGYYSTILALGVTLGQLLGGLIVTADLGGLGWRSAFLVNLPVGGLLLAAAGRAVPRSEALPNRSLDIAGVTALTLSLLLILVPLLFAHELGWKLWMWISLGAGAVGIPVFAVVERRVKRRGGTPLLAFDALFAPGIGSGTAIVSVGFAGYGGLLLAITLYVQTTLGFTPIQSGLTFCAYAIGFGVANLNWSRLPGKVLRWTPSVALLAFSVAQLAFAVVERVDGWQPQIAIPLLLSSGAAHGLAFGPVVSQMTARIPASQRAALSGLVATTVQLSIVIGIASLGSLYLGGATGGLQAAAHAMSSVAWVLSAALFLAIAIAVRLAQTPIPSP